MTVSLAPAEDWMHRPATYWFWHRIPTDAEISAHVARMAAAGIGSFQIQARMALPRADFLGSTYCRAYRLAVEAAARAGLVVGVYDDYNWQSGHAAGRAVEGHDELRERHLFWTVGSVEGGVARVGISGIRTATASLGPAAMDWQYEGAEARWTDWTVFCAVVVPGRHGHPGRPGRPLDVTADVAVLPVSDDRDGPLFVVTRPDLPDGTAVAVFASARSLTSRLVNFVDRRAVERFVEAAYEPVRAAVGDYFGTTVRYLFFDQPHANFHTWREQVGNLRSSLPFGPDLDARLRARFGADLPANLLAVLFATDDAATRRLDFHETFSEFAITTFLGTVRDWCHRHGLLLSGHEVLPQVGGWEIGEAFQEFDLRANFGMDFFAVDACRDLTAVDAQDSGAQLSPLLGASVARHCGRRGCIVEQYYAGGATDSGVYPGRWDLPLGELRSQAIRQHFLGMRQWLFHGWYLSDGWADDPTMFLNPRFYFPPGQNLEPWFDRYHRDFADESTRLSIFLDGIVPACDVAVVFPRRTLWADGQHEERTRFGGWCRVLSDEGLDVHVLDERDLESATVGDAGLGVGNRTFRCLLLPGVRILGSPEITAILAAAARCGVRVAVAGETPVLYHRGGSAAADWEELRTAGTVTWVHGDPDVPGAVAAVVGTDGPPAAVATRSLPGIRTCRGAADDGWRLAVFNDSENSVCVELQGRFAAAIGVDGSGLPTPGSTGTDGGWTDVVPPSGLLMLTLDIHPEEWSLRTELSPRPDCVELVRGWEISTGAEGDNGSGDVAERSTAEHDGGGWRRVAVDRGWEVQGWPTFSGTATYRCRFESPREMPHRWLRLPRVGGSATVTLNGTPLGRRGWAPYEFDLDGSLLEDGPNELRIEVANTAGNRCYAGTGFRRHLDPSGLLAPPELSAR